MKKQNSNHYKKTTPPPKYRHLKKTKKTKQHPPSKMNTPQKTPKPPCNRNNQVQFIEVKFTKFKIATLSRIKINVNNLTLRIHAKKCTILLPCTFH